MSIVTIVEFKGSFFCSNWFFLMNFVFYVVKENVRLFDRVSYIHYAAAMTKSCLPKKLFD
jgi:hypothetical protein